MRGNHRFRRRVSIQLVSKGEWGGIDYTPHTAQCVQRPFARTPKNVCTNSLSPREKISETLTGQYIEG